MGLLAINPYSTHNPGIGPPLGRGRIVGYTETEIRLVANFRVARLTRAQFRETSSDLDGQILNDCNRLISFNYGGNRNSEQIRLATGAPVQNG